MDGTLEVLLATPDVPSGDGLCQRQEFRRPRLSKMDLASEAPKDVVGILLVGRRPMMRRSDPRGDAGCRTSCTVATRHTVESEAPATR